MRSVLFRSAIPLPVLALVTALFASGCGNLTAPDSNQILKDPDAKAAEKADGAGKPTGAAGAAKAQPGAATPNGATGAQQPANGAAKAPMVVKPSPAPQPAQPSCGG
ncbi:MAG: hypothetical protein U0414_28425 [Polyangiaceae bacterium]